MSPVAPYGSWSSPITLDHLVEQVVGLSFPLAADGHLWWTEQRPSEGGRQVVVRVPLGGGAAEDVFGPDHHVRTLAHEYGGLAYAVSGGTVYFCNFADQRIHRVVPGGVPEPLTPEPPSPRSVRYAAPVVTPDGRHLVAVRERHPEPDRPADVVNDLVVLPTDGPAEPRAVAGGHDFYAHPVVSPDGRHLAWISWDHPDMPWDATELWEAALGEDGTVTGAHRVAGGPGESVTQPRYGPDGVLRFVSDRTGWWNLYAAGPEVRALAPMDADLGEPDWVFGVSSYAVLDDGAVVATWWEGGLGRLGVLRPGASAFDALDTACNSFTHLRPGPDGASVVAVAGGPTEPWAVVRIAVPAASVDVPAAPADVPAAVGGPVSADVRMVKRSRASVVEPSAVSVPEPIEFPTGGGLTAHALFYPPRNPGFEAPPGERPPLIVRSHGGPTSAATPVLNYAVQFWTSRGFAVVDVNYGGSTGYGRAYRQRLQGRWGIVDLDDCVNAARHLAAAGRVDGDRLLIHGGSAGGYTTLCALTFRDDFAAGASYYGVADAGALARDTHKFESRYMDRLIGPWPEAEAVYRERSPLFHTDRLRTPLILFQGLDDKVVPPNQAQSMADALERKGVPYAYVVYEGEAHGFRRAETITRTAEAELYFYGRVLGFTPADELAPVEIHHEERLGR